MSDKMQNYKTYIDIIFKETNKDIDWSDKGKMDELGKVIYNYIFEINGPKKISKKPSDKSIFLWNVLFRPLGEIIESFETIKNISLFINSFPYKTSKISKVKFLQYHIANYLNELYILQNRLKLYLTKIQRGYRKSNNHTIIKTMCKPLSENVNSIFKVKFDARGIHVHEKRYSDRELDRISSLELLTLGSDNNKERSDFIQLYFITEYKKVRRKWTIRLKKDIKYLESILETYFEVLLTLITDKGAISYPSNQNWN